MESIDFPYNGPAIDEDVVFKRPSFEYVEVDLVNILQVFSEFQESLVDDALSDFLMLEDKHLSQRRFA